MASLKRVYFGAANVPHGAFHGRKIMASLKPDGGTILQHGLVHFPWSKDHGLIEACWCHQAIRTSRAFPWSKDHGLIEARLLELHRSKHWPLSMVERSWPH